MAPLSKLQAFAPAKGASPLTESARQGPLYREVRRHILECLARGEWQAGDMLPTERDLAQRFGVAVSTVRAGVSQLTTSGVLVRRQGRGTFVAGHDLSAQRLRFSNVYDNAANKLSTVRRVRTLRRVRAEGDALRLVQQPQQRFVISVEATLLAAEHPVAALTLLLPAHLFPNARAADFEESGQNLYTLYQKKWGVTVLRMEEWVYARTADARTARILRVRRCHPVMHVERVAYTFGDVPVEVRIRVYEGLGHRYRFSHDKLD